MDLSPPVEVRRGVDISPPVEMASRNVCVLSTLEYVVRTMCFSCNQRVTFVGLRPTTVGCSSLLLRRLRCESQPHPGTSACCSALSRDHHHSSLFSE